MAVTKNEFFDRIIASLSGGLVDVELGVEDMDVAYKLAKQTYLQLGNANQERDFYSLAVTAGTLEYTLTVPSGDPEILSISAVLRSNELGGSGFSDPFVLSAYNQMFSPDTGSSNSVWIIYDLTKQMQDTIRQYTVYESEWVHNRRKNSVKFLKAPQQDGVYLLDCYHTPADESLYDDLWVFKYTLAEAKCILGRAYRKFGSLASPTGETQIDGNDLVTEGKEEKRELEEAIMDMQYGDEDAIGVYFG